jgi:hypothetical protein
MEAVMNRVALAALSLLALPALAATSARVGPYELQLLVEGQPTRTFAAGGDTWVLGQLGQRYVLRVNNRSGQRIEAVVSVDGRDVIDGQPGEVHKRGYLVPAYGSVTIDGWRISQAEAAAFRFSSVADSYAARVGNGREVGIIGVAVFPERARPIEPAPAPIPLGRGAMPMDERGAIADSAQPAAPATNGASAPRAAAKAARPGLGTEYGEPVSSHVTEVPFERTSSWPAARLAVRYDDRAGLAAMGIDVDRVDEVAVRRSAEPFPAVDRQYAPPPPGWSR